MAVSFYRFFPSSLRLKTPPFTFTSRIQLTTKSDAETFYNHLLRNSQNPEKTLPLIRAKLDGQSVSGVLHRCGMANPELGLRFFFWAGLQSGYRHNHYMFSLACKLFDIEKNPNKVMEVLEAYRNEGFVAKVKIFKLVLNLCKEAGIADEALKILRKMEEFGCRPDTTMFNAVIRLFCQKGDFDVAMELLKEMEATELYPDMISYMLLLKGFCDAGRMEDACKLFKVMRNNECTPNLVAYSCLLDGLCKSGDFEKGFELLEEMEKEGEECMPNILTYTSVIQRFCAKGKSIEALPILDRMKNHKCFPNGVTMSILIEGLCNDGHIDEAYKVIGGVIAGGLVSSSKCYSSLVISLMRNKRVEEAKRLFRWMLGNAVRPDGLACTILTKELCMEGKFLDAFNLYEDVEKAGHILSMDSAAFCDLLFGLCEQNCKKEAAKLASLMVEKGIQIRAPCIQAVKGHLKGLVNMDLLSKLYKSESGC